MEVRKEVREDSFTHPPPLELEGAEHDALVEEATICKIEAHQVWDMCYYMTMYGTPDPKSGGLFSKLW